MNTDPNKIGYEDGEPCNREGCEGMILLAKPEGCTCFMGNPPCSSCVNVQHYCTNCDWEEEDESN